MFTYIFATLLENIENYVHVVERDAHGLST
jgi:hypothetical protein